MTISILDKIHEYDKAFLVTSDGDFFTLVKRLNDKGKLGGVISPHKKTCSRLLKKASEGKITYLSEVIDKIKKEAVPQCRNNFWTTSHVNSRRD